ncbi:MAG TPA: hypothetical protein VLQ45_00205 [Thermoanaerobaculia bacterium]|nr:hypothetical protein [Thermoanaerobaculia bacterium]
MTCTGFRRKTVLLLLAAVLLFPWAAFAGPQTGSPRAAHVSTSTFLDLLARAWGSLAATWEKEGCHLDPSGLCTPVTPEPTIQTDTGCHIDPHGGCRS